MAAVNSGSVQGRKSRFHDGIWQWALLGVAGICLSLAMTHAVIGLALPAVSYPKDVVKDVVAYFAVAVGALALLRAGSLTKAKLPGVELEFEAAVSDKIHKDGAELKELAVQLAEIKLALGKQVPGDALLDMGLKSDLKPLLPVPTVLGDQQKNRFGGHSQVDGFRLSARFNSSYDAKIVSIELAVDQVDGLPLSSNVRFYLHETFDPAEITVAPNYGRAVIDLLAHGGFTVGAWIEATNTLLELDLSKLRGAPRVIKEL